MWKVPLFDLDYGAKEYKAVKEVLDSKWLSAGPKVREFEDGFARYLGSDAKCCAVANCTAALHMALLLNNIGKGDEVILSGLTFVAAINVVMMVGAMPVLADSKSLCDWNVSPEDIRKKITKKTKAIIIVHFAGYPCDMDEILSISRGKNIILIEDVAHAIGAEYKGKKCGTFGDISCFSFFSNKNLSTGEGGMLVSHSENIDKHARLLRSHGMTSMTIDRHFGKTISYDVLQPGLNYRMDEIRAALGIVQLEKLDKNNLKREKLVDEYIRLISQINEIIIPWSKRDKEKKSSYHIFPILLPKNIERVQVINYMKDNGIQTSIHYPAFKTFSFYNKIIKENLNIANEISGRVITLPLYPTMKQTNVKLICNILGKIVCQK